MANLKYITKNNLILEANKKRLQVLIIAQIIVLGMFFTLKKLFPEREIVVYITIILMTYIFYRRIPNVGAILRAGGKGEQKALRILKALPKNYTIFNHILIPFYPNSEKMQEIDYIVIGPSAIFVIEVKNNSGYIRASRQDKKWLVRKHQQTKDMVNPLKQLDRQIRLLGKLLSADDLYPKIFGLILFVNKYGKLNIPKDMKELVYKDKEIVKWIKRQENKYPPIEKELITELLQIAKRTHN